LRIGDHVMPGQEVGAVREWPGQPRRSHLHWGVNALGVAQATRDGWGWGRAPITATQADALARGWVNLNATLSSLANLPAERPNSGPANACRQMVAQAWVLVRARRPVRTWQIDFEQVTECFDSEQELHRFMDAVDAFDPQQP